MSQTRQLDTARRTIYDADHALFRDQVRKFFAVHLLPHLDRWEEAGIIDRSFWSACGEAGVLCPGVPEQYGGLGLDFRYNAIIGEELAYAGSSAGITLQSDVTADYIAHYGSEEQKEKWLPRMISGEAVVAIAMTEPGTGSDLQAIRTTARAEGSDYIVDGSKTYITNGQHADLVIVVAKTDPALGAKGTSLILVEAERAGFARGRNLDKIGQHSSDTSELFFENVRVPASNLIGTAGRGFSYLVQQLPQERLTIAVGAQAAAQRAFDEALAFTRERRAFGKAILDFQATRFTLAEMATQLQVGWAHLDWAIARHVAGELTIEEAAAAKLFHSELQNRVCDAALQLHGGAGYMNEYAIARLWRDARVSRIYGGTSEIMKEVIGRAL
ncbi:acyl-CoA dehydrogenase family protein [Novosphingobium sp. YJ-S2-02]|uniref:Acyl-CoA dehydrogenase family protein n=1 Tax=Novosphingobium aureum TaxID=2792964 RepID=A0A931HA37_9SPHN|nr:acyl-CoA dehydrogenase family protein [Novosphingobium aureum]MBH0112037.1 acyl-CoA dehydrogenase family protein [Novosphingobium aureum]